MRLLLYVFIINLWSSTVFADDTSPVINDYDKTDAFEQLPADYAFENKSDTIEVANMPRIRSQDSFNTCFGCSSATIVQKYLCDNHPDYKNKNCSNLDKELEVSQFDLISKTLTNTDGQSAELPSNHTNIRIKLNDRKKSAGVLALINSKIKFSFNTEACFPFDQLVQKYGNASTELVEKMLARLELYYQTKRTEANTLCIECITDINSSLNLSIDQEKFNFALKKNTFGEFLYSLIFNKKCDKKIELDEGPKVGIYPKSNQPSEKFELLNQVKLALGNASQNRPVLLGNVCLYFNSQTKECLTHSLVISGYKTMCTQSNKSSQSELKCKPLLKVHNCWGEDWQKKNNNGWVDAEKLLKNISRTSDKLNDGVLSWLSNN